MIEPMPPMTTTAKTTMIRLLPINGCTCRIGAARTPANPASATPKPYVKVTINGTLTPNASVSGAFSVPARSKAPSLVRSMTYQVPKHTTSEATTTHVR